MKKLISLHAVIVFLLTGTFMTAFAQDSHVSILLNMVNSRFNYGEMNSSLRKYKKDGHGLQAGLSWQAGMTKNFSIVTEGYFVRKGGILKTGNPLNGIKSTMKLNTVEVPVLARFHAGRWYFNAGPYVNYILSGKASSEAESEHSILFGRETDEFRKWGVGVQAGTGFQFRLKKTKMAADLRYAQGLTSISSTDKLYNRTINLSILTFMSWKRKGD